MDTIKLLELVSHRNALENDALLLPLASPHAISSYFSAQ